ncbi:MAG TPA: T9SS type A sorting domain-containing protein [Bacteroidia bacterium]|nr:T9SS type A sorting domain-containing protein [Bacteroidia bacterium]
MNLKSGFTCVAMIVFAVSTKSFSQWNSNSALNTSVCVQPYDQQDVHIVTDGNNGAIMMWLDFRNDATQNAGDIFAQRINKNGFNLWTISGVAICSDAADQAAPDMIESENSGAIIAWTDLRNGNRDIYAQKVDSSGIVQWTVSGEAVAMKPATQQNVQVISDGTGGAIIVWEDSVNGAFDIYAQRMSSAGTAIWASGGVAVCNMVLGQINPKIIPDGAGGAVVVWQDFRNGNDYNIYTQKINSAGVVQWTANGVAMATVAGTQSNPKLRGDGSGGAIIVWQDKRFGINFDVYAQCVNSSGAVQWTANGVIICNAGDNQSALDMTSEGISGAIITWKDNRNLNHDIYAQMINLSGTVQWTANGIVIATGTAEQINPNAIGDGNGGAIIVWQDSSAGNWDVKSQRVSSGGTIMWTAGGEAVGTAAASQTDPKNVSDGLGGSIYTWNDKRSTNDFDIYANHLFSDGMPVGIHKENYSYGVNVYPNPFVNKAIISTKLFESTADFKIRIVDAFGKEANPKITRNGASFEIFRNNLPAGIYFYEIISGNGTSIFSKGKFVIAD